MSERPRTTALITGASIELVDAALSSFDAGEEVTIPSLPEQADWDAYSAARTRLVVYLSRQHPAERYRRAA